MTRVRKLLCVNGVLALCLAGAACAGSEKKDADAGHTPRGIAPPTRIPDPVMEAGPVGTPVATADIPRAIRRAVVADAARRFGVAESAVVLSAAEQVTWSDGALGCPEPGRSYAQMLMPGYRLTATTASGSLRYHANARGNLVTCAELRRF
jgi:hypothetical protein